ncbi:MAG: hypothetical protein AAFU74_14065, partial [Bacteroidota bacterium]
MKAVFIVLLFSVSSNGIAQHLDTWFTADRAVNTPAINPISSFLPYPPFFDVDVDIWYDIIDFETQDAVPHPFPANDATYQLAPPFGFDYPFGDNGIDYLFPAGSVPGQPVLRSNIFNFNPAIEFNGNGDGQALHYRSISRNETTVFIVFAGNGSGSSAETQRLLFGGDVDNHPTTSRATNLSLGISDGNRFSVGRTRNGLDANASMFQSGNFDLLGRPTIGMFQREVLSEFQERLTTRVNGIDDINWVRDEGLFPIADTQLFPFNRIGKHFNSGNADSDRNFTGHIAEIFVLDTPAEINLSDVIERIESYLAIKYGITLNSSGLGSTVGNDSYNYLAADGSIIWDFDLSNPYIFDIAGIGRDRFRDIEGGPTSYDDTKLRYNLHQRISKSVNSEAVVTISNNNDFNPDNLDDNRPDIDGRLFSPHFEYNYLLWGNDHGNLNLTASEVPAGVSDRIGREWLVSKTATALNPINNVSVKIELGASDIPLASTCDIFLIIDSDSDGDEGDFTSGPVTYIPLSSVDEGNRIVYFENVNFEHRDVFTIGYGDVINPTASNPPTQDLCDVIAPPIPDISVVADASDNCMVAGITHMGDMSDGNSNPEIITRTYRVTDLVGNFIDVTQIFNLYNSPDATLIVSSADDPICEGTNTNITVDFSEVGVSYQLRNDLGNVEIGAPVIGTGGTINLPTGNLTTTTTFNILAISGICAPVQLTDLITITLQAPPDAGSNGSLTICEGDIVTAAQLFAQLGGTPDGGGTWSPALAGAGVYTYTVDATAPCTTDDTATVTVNINTPPTVDAGSDETICSSDALDLSASAVVPTTTDFGSLAWSTAGDGSFDDNTLLTPVYTPGATDIADGAVVLTLQANGNGSCPDVLDIMTLILESAPTADAGSDEEICAGDEFRIIESSTIPSVTNISNLIWSTAGDGNFSNNVVLAPHYFPGPDDILNGSVVLTLQANPNAPCVLPAIDFMTLTINAPPTPTIIGATNVCLDAEEVYTTEAGQNNYIWNVTGGIITNDAGNAITVDWNGAGPYEVSVNYEDANGCTAASATVQAINVETPPNSGNAVAQTACSTEAAFDLFTALDGTQDGGGTWIDDDGTGALSGADNSVFDASAVAAGGANYNFTYRVTGANCTDSDTQVTVTVNDAHTIVVNGFTDPTTCSGNNGEIVLNFTDVADGVYTIDYDGGSFGNVNISGNQATVSNLIAGAYINLSLTLGDCTSSGFPDVILDDPTTPTVTLVGSSNPTLCGVADGSITLSFTGVPDGGPYDIDYDGGSLSGQMVVAGQTTITNLGQGSYNNLSITRNGCTSNQDIDVILSDPALPTIAINSFTDPTTCNASDGQIQLTFTGVPNGNQTINYGGGNFPVVVAANSATITGLSAGSYDNLAITVSGCTSTEDPDVTLNNFVLPTISVTNFTNPSTCSGDDGQIALNITGVTSNGLYDIAYDGGVFTNIPVNAISGWAAINGLSEGNYDNLSITVNGCTSAGNPDVTLT